MLTSSIYQNSKQLWASYQSFDFIQHEKNPFNHPGTIRNRRRDSWKITKFKLRQNSFFNSFSSLLMSMNATSSEIQVFMIKLMEKMSRNSSAWDFEIGLFLSMNSFFPWNTMFMPKHTRANFKLRKMFNVRKKPLEIVWEKDSFSEEYLSNFRKSL